nr:putative integron gene cassette protein [uncultured bacterium]
MYENLGYLISGASILLTFLALSGIYPASKVFQQRTLRSRRLLWTIVGLALAAPLTMLVIYQIRLSSLEHPDARALQMMPVTLQDLPFLYLLSASVAALLLWVLFAWTKRTAG